MLVVTQRDHAITLETGVHRSVDFVPVAVKNNALPLANISNITVFQHLITRGHWQQRGDVRGDQVLAIGETDEKGWPLARRHQTIWIANVNHTQGITTLKLPHRCAHRSHQIQAARHVKIDLMHHHLGIGV